MITRLFPNVHRFIPFTFIALCVIAVTFSPYKAFATSTYALYSVNWGGASLNDGVQPIDSIDFYTNGDFKVPHQTDVSHIGTIVSSTTPEEVHANSDWTINYAWGGGGSATAHSQPGPGSGGGPTYTLVDELKGVGSPASVLAGPAPTGDYFISWPGGNSSNQTTYCFVLWNGINVDTSHCGTEPSAPGDPCDSGDTRICGFTPENGSVVTGPNVYFTLDAWLASQDLGTGDRIHIRLHNIDQNVLLLGSLSPSDKILLDQKFYPGDDGHFAFSTTTALADGNYRLEAWLEKSIFFGFIKNPFDTGADQVISKQFIVGTSTFIGNLSQNGFNILNGIAASSTATSSAALVAQCNPLGNFNMTNCLFGLFIPDSNQVQKTIEGARDGILTRLPWGYFTRLVTILNSNATSTLPTYTVEFAQNTASDTTTLSFDPGDMFTGGAAVVESIHDPYNNKTLRDIFQPIVQLVVALMVLFTIVADITGSHKHDGPSGPGEVASKRRRT